MCLYTKMKEPIVAKKPITCYKILRKNMHSIIYKSFEWEFGKLYETEMQFYESSLFGIVPEKIAQAFHSYKSYKDVRGACLVLSHPFIIVECTIPTGATFYAGCHGDEEGFASNQIIINKVVDVKKVFSSFPWDEYPYKEGQTIRIIPNGRNETYKIENILPDCDSLVYLVLDNESIYLTDRQGKSIYDFKTEIVGQSNKED